ncbi:MAG TPA: hypothetical protein VMB84_16725 [Stellaceae bacterium]|nr:hypothetical protein [Stellaceae bacterium]
MGDVFAIVLGDKKRLAIGQDPAVLTVQMLGRDDRYSLACLAPKSFNGVAARRLKILQYQVKSQRIE